MSGFSGILVKSEQYQPVAATFQFPEKLSGDYPCRQQTESGCLRIALYDNHNPVNSSQLTAFDECISGAAGIIFNPEALQKVEIHKPEEGLPHVKGGFTATGYAAKTETFWLATDTTGSRQVFYYDHPSFLLFSSSIFLLRDMLRHFGISYKVSKPAAYMMLSLGYMLEEYTLIAEIKKLPAGHVLHFNGKQTILKQYHNYYQEIKHSEISKGLLNDLDDLFQEAVRIEYELDKEKNKIHIAMLSGGLDSRLNVMLAHKQGFKELTCLTFGQGLVDDELTARKISQDLDLKHIVLLLNGGFQLYDIDSPLILNNCSVYYFGAAQTLAAVRQLDFTSWGLMHHGNLAESSKGGYLSGKKQTPPQLERRYATSDRLFGKIPADLLQAIYARYPNNEMFVTYSRGFNATHNGNWMTLPFAHSVYTYMDQDFAALAYSIAPNLRYNGYLTVEWIRQLHPELAKYPWKLGLKPTNDPKRIFASRIYNKLVRQFLQPNNTYVPFDHWYRHNKQLRNYIHTTFSELDSLQDIVPENLYKEVQQLFAQGNVVEKLLCVSFTRSLRLLFV